MAKIYKKSTDRNQEIKYTHLMKRNFLPVDFAKNFTTFI